MALLAKKKTKSSVPPLAADTYPAVCVGVVDLGGIELAGHLHIGPFQLCHLAAQHIHCVLAQRISLFLEVLCYIQLFYIIWLFSCVILEICSFNVSMDSFIILARSR